jgi:hypothetical protein
MSSPSGIDFLGVSGVTFWHSALTVSGPVAVSLLTATG